MTLNELIDRLQELRGGDFTDCGENQVQIAREYFPDRVEHVEMRGHQVYLFATRAMVKQ